MTNFIISISTFPPASLKGAIFNFKSIIQKENKWWKGTVYLSSNTELTRQFTSWDLLDLNAFWTSKKLSDEAILWTAEKEQMK